jgi:hypothetical protein
MQSQKWGPSAWTFLHSVSFNYPLLPSFQDKLNYKNFFHSIQFILPCSFCRDYYSILLKYIKIDKYLDSRGGITFWLFIIHNLINKKLKYPLETFQNVVLKYENLRARCGSIHNNVNYYECIKKLNNITCFDINDNIIHICNKYKIIVKKQLFKLYLSNDVNDPDLL